ncbi:MAG: Uma2 family endonuclease [Pyrinomonadaceae bacterium]|nr:Uma2 family endonuclease [Pyrinomonadaceae bacterium]
MSVITQIESIPVTLDLNIFKLTDETFYEFCRRNEEYRFEMDADGKIIVMPPTFLDSSKKNAKIIVQLGIWAAKDGSGEVFESDGMITLLNGAKRAPDAFWISKEKYYALSKNEREQRFARIVPDFLIELRSVSDTVERLRAKMTEYIENGVRLGWLIDPVEKRVYVFRENGSVEILEAPKTVSGENVLKDFELDLTEIFD